MNAIALAATSAEHVALVIEKTTSNAPPLEELKAALEATREREAPGDMAYVPLFKKPKDRGWSHKRL